MILVITIALCCICLLFLFYYIYVMKYITETVGKVKTHKRQEKINNHKIKTFQQIGKVLIVFAFILLWIIVLSPFFN